MFIIVSGLRGQDYDDFLGWLKSLDSKVKAAALTEFEIMKRAGLGPETAVELLNQVMETHVYPFYEAAAFLLLGRDLRTAEVFCFGYFDRAGGSVAAVEEVYQRACRYFRWTRATRIGIVLR